MGMMYDSLAKLEPCKSHGLGFILSDGGAEDGAEGLAWMHQKPGLASTILSTDGVS